MELKSKREAAALLGISTRGIERAVRRGQLEVRYRDSKHGRKAWFSPAALDRYRDTKESRISGFMIGDMPRVGTLVPIGDVKPSQAGATASSRGAGVRLCERLMLTLAQAVELSGLPRSYLNQSIRSGRLKHIKIGRSTYVKRLDLEAFVASL